jgi:hypothetical protein
LKIPLSKKNKPVKILIELERVYCSDLVGIASFRNLKEIPFRTFLCIFLRESIIEYLDKHKLTIKNGYILKQEELNLKPRGKI